MFNTADLAEKTTPSTELADGVADSDGTHVDREEAGIPFSEESGVQGTLSAAKIYQIVTYSHDSGTDDKREYATMDKAVEAGRQYLADGWDGFAILNTAEHKIELYEGDFPMEGIFSERVYRNSGEWHRITATPNLAEPKQSPEQADIHIVAELFGLDEDKLRELVEAKPTEATINQYGMLERVRDTKDMDKVKAYFESMEGTELSTLRLNAKLNGVLRNFILHGEMPEILVLDKPISTPNVDTYINRPEEMKAVSLSTALRRKTGLRTKSWT